MGDKKDCPLVQLIEESGTDPSLWFPEWRRVTMLESEQLSAIRGRHASATNGPREWNRFHEHCWQDVADLLDTVGELRERERGLSQANDDLAARIIRLERIVEEHAPWELEDDDVSCDA